MEIFKDEKGQKIFSLFMIAQALSTNMAQTPEEKITPDQVKFLSKNYETIRNELAAIDSKAMTLVPYLGLESDINYINYREKFGNLKVALSQLMAYLTSLLSPVFFNFIKNMGWVKFESGPVERVFPFLSKLGLSPNWVTAASALCLLEVMVNKKLEEFGGDISGKFEQRVNRLRNLMQERGTRIPELLPTALYDIRSKVIHAGKEPTPDELEQILKFLSNFSKQIWS